MRAYSLLISLVTILVIVASSKEVKSKTRIFHIFKRSISSLNNLKAKRYSIPIASNVDDVSESTAFRDREQKLHSVMQGEMYPIHSLKLRYKRKNINHNLRKWQKSVTGMKKDVIETHIPIEEDYIEKQSPELNEGNDDTDSDDEDEDDSGSGRDEDELSETNDNDSNEGGDKSMTLESSSTDDKTHCRKKCSMPMSFHECAFPRCSAKMGSIKDLCFYLCKHQKAHCEHVCE